MPNEYKKGLSYFTDLQGSQTLINYRKFEMCLVTLLIYKVLKPANFFSLAKICLVTLLIYKVLKPVPSIYPAY